MVKHNEMAMQTLAGLPTNMPVARVEFDYDYMSRRVGKTVYEWGSNDWQEVSSAVFLYDAWNLISEQTSAETNFFTFGLDLSGTLQGAGGVGGLLSAMLGTNAVCYTYDGNGNVSDLINCAGGAICSHYEYSPFGETIVATGELAKSNPFRFSAKYTDDETSLVYYGYRYYLPGLGRWVNRDAVGDESFLRLQLTNLDRKERRKREKQLRGAALKPLYIYVDNRPISEIDPLGLDNPGGGGQNQVCCATSPGSGGSSGPSAACSACANAVGANVLLQLAHNGINGTDDTGGGNAFRHCLAACQTSRACGSDCARSFWDCRENPNDPAGQQDLANNQVGYGIQGSCWDGCNNAWDNGKLNCQGQPCPPR